MTFSLSIKTADDLASEAISEHAKVVKAECSRRIYEVLDAPTVSNIQGIALMGELSAKDMEIFRSGQYWINDMLVASRAMATDINAQWQSDKSWPDIPNGLIDLAARF